MAPQNLRTILQQRGITVQELTRLTSLSPSTVYKVINSKRVGTESAFAIACALRLGLNDIIWGRLPGCVTKPIGKTGTNKQMRADKNDRLCNIHNEFYPNTLDECPLCE